MCAHAIPDSVLLYPYIPLPQREWNEPYQRYEGSVHDCEKKARNKYCLLLLGYGQQLAKQEAPIAQFFK